MLVKNNTARVIGLGGANDGGTTTLIPGVNEVDDAVWSKAQTVAVKALLKKQEGEDGPALELIGGGEAAAPSQPGTAPAGTDTGTAGLASKNVTDAKALIAETYDRKLLEKWRSEDTRHTVQQAIDEQLEKLKLSDAEKKKR